VHLNIRKAEVAVAETEENIWQFTCYEKQ